MSRAGAGSLPRYILQRILLVIPMIWVILTLVFVVLRVAPGDPVSAALGLVEGDGMTRIPVVGVSNQLLGLVCFNRSHEAFCVYPS